MPFQPALRIVTIIVAIPILTSPAFLFAQDSRQDGKVRLNYTQSQDSPRAGRRSHFIAGASLQDNLGLLQRQARMYRQQGLELQRIGDIEGAMSLYQKAIELDPAYAVAYNDLGIIYEGKGFTQRAEESYLQAITIDPAYLSSYSNLALLYENKRDLKNAAIYWKKRVELGEPQDLWTQKAKRRLEDILLILKEQPLVSREQEQEKEVLDFLQDVAKKKSLTKQDNKSLAKSYFEKAKLSYKKGDYVVALKQAIDAQLLDPANKSVVEFIDELQKRLLSR